MMTSAEQFQSVVITLHFHLITDLVSLLSVFDASRKQTGRCYPSSFLLYIHYSLKRDSTSQRGCHCLPSDFTAASTT